MWWIRATVIVFLKIVTREKVRRRRTRNLSRRCRASKYRQRRVAHCDVRRVSNARATETDVILSRADVTRETSRTPIEPAEGASACLESSRAARLRAVVSFFLKSLARDACARVVRAADTAAMLSRVGLSPTELADNKSRHACARLCLLFACDMRRIPAGVMRATAIVAFAGG